MITSITEETAASTGNLTVSLFVAFGSRQTWGSGLQSVLFTTGLLAEINR